MSGKSISKGSFDASQHTVVDSQLKSLKIITRRLQSALIIHETELHVLERLVYKNKNQHRKALFWRNVIEIRRYSERVDNLKLLDDLQLLRSLFYGSSLLRTNSMKGPWTHFPRKNHLCDLSKKIRMAKDLVEKMSEACSRAYNSFHRSLQSAAFLQLLLVFVAISSRMNMISIELKDCYYQADSCISCLIISSERSEAATSTIGRSVHIESAGPEQVPTQDLDFTTVHPISNREQIDIDLSNESSSLAVTLETVIKPSVIIERNALPKTTKCPAGNAQTIESLVTPKKKRRKATRNEIDDIFNF